MTANGRIKRKLHRAMKRDKEYFNGFETGCYGAYIRIKGGKGIKIYKEYLEPKEALLKARNEIKLLKEAKSRFDLVPKSYGIKMLKIGDRIVVGIILQHLGNITLQEANKRVCNDKWETITSLKKQMSEVGITHRDLHNNNVMFYKNKFWPIDFGDNGVTIDI